MTPDGQTFEEFCNELPGRLWMTDEQRDLMGTTVALALYTVSVLVREMATGRLESPNGVDDDTLLAQSVSIATSLLEMFSARGGQFSVIPEIFEGAAKAGMGTSGLPSN